MSSLADIVVKACPFCGGEAHTAPGAFRRWFVVCSGCGATANHDDGADEAIAAWNTRTDPLAALVLEAREKGRALIAHRVGELPTRGWLRDNDASRADLAAFAATLAKLEAL